MRILLLGFTKMKFMPYASFYLNQIDCLRNDVHIVYWNRDLKEENLSKYSQVYFHEFRYYMEDSIAKRLKLKYFFEYRKFVLSILRQKSFDMIISLHTLPGLLLLDKLTIKYKYKYILDYRDSTFEANFIFGKMVKHLASCSKVTFVSSDAFRQFLPKKSVKIITSHNILEDSLKHREDRKQFLIPSEKIRISFWGLIRHLTHNILIIDRLANDERFELHYYGRELKTGKMLREHCLKHGIENVFFHGEYVPEDRYKFIKQTDIIHNSYLDANMLLAMGNKYYDGIIFRIPQLCMVGSYMASRCQEKGVGCAFDPNDENYADNIYRYYNSLDERTFDENCDNDLAKILKEYTEGTEYVKNLLNDR